MKTETRRCPYCGGDISDEDRQCRHCDEILVPTETTAVGLDDGEPLMEQPHAARSCRMNDEWRSWFGGCFADILIRSYADFRGSLSRADYWRFVLCLIIVLWSTAMALLLNLHTGFVLTGVLVALLVVPSVATAARRLHDVGRSGLWVLLPLVPVVGGVWLVVLLCGKGVSSSRQVAWRWSDTLVTGLALLLVAGSVVRVRSDLGRSSLSSVVENAVKVVPAKYYVVGDPISADGRHFVALASDRYDSVSDKPLRSNEMAIVTVDAGVLHPVFTSVRLRRSELFRHVVTEAASDPDRWHIVTLDSFDGERRVLFHLSDDHTKRTCTYVGCVDLITGELLSIDRVNL